MTTTMRHLGARRRIRSGFTMVELIVTISIIAVLVALTVYAASALVLRSETQRTQDALKLLESAAQEWTVASERQITFGDDGAPPGAIYEIKWDDLEVPSYITVQGEAQFVAPGNQSEVDDLTRRFVRKIEKTPATREMLARIDSKLLRKAREAGITPEDWTIVRDAWDVPIRVILPGRDHAGVAPPADEGAADPDVDGTIRSVFEIRHGMCLSRRLFFVSAGPDGKFGDLHLTVLTADLTPTQLADIDLAADNVYSSTPGGERN